MEAVGRRIRAELDRQNMSLAEFARRIEVDPRTAKRSSNGEGRFSIGTAIMVTYALMMPWKQLFEDAPADDADLPSESSSK